MRGDDMKALVLVEPGRMELQRVATPAPGPGEALIKVVSATTCGTDLKAYLRGHPQIPMPGLFGHEYSGVVVESGEGCPFRPGDEVMGVHSAPCGQCRWCRRGQQNLCESIMSTKVLGSYAEYLLIPQRIAFINLFAKPDTLGFDEASLLEPLACVAHGIARSHPLPEDRVLVIGPGAIGLMFVAALRAIGVEDVTLAGRNESRLSVGQDLGAKIVPWQSAEGLYDLVIECTGKVEVWEKAPDFADRGSTVMLFGGCPGGTRVSFDTAKLHYDDVTLISPFHFCPQDVRQAREWLIAAPRTFEKLITGPRRLEEAQATFEDLNKGVGLKYVFHPSD
jgi:L-iditol 2-dehydrogenase